MKGAASHLGGFARARRSLAASPSRLSPRRTLFAFSRRRMTSASSSEASRYNSQFCIGHQILLVELSAREGGSNPPGGDPRLTIRTSIPRLPLKERSTDQGYWGSALALGFNRNTVNSFETSTSPIPSGITQIALYTALMLLTTMSPARARQMRL